MAFKDTYRLEKVYYENIWTLLNLLKNIDKNNVDMGTVKELLDNAIADNESIIIIYKNLGELYAELQNQHMELGKELEKLRNSLEEFKDEINDKIDENHNYIMGLIREIEQRLDDLENRVEDLEERMTQAETDIDNLEGRMTTAEGDIDALETAVDGLDDDLTALEGRVDIAEGDIDDLEQNKQDKLTAGSGIAIDPDTNEISNTAQGKIYTAGSLINISNNVISCTPNEIVGNTSFISDNDLPNVSSIPAGTVQYSTSNSFEINMNNYDKGLLVSLTHSNFDMNLANLFAQTTLDKLLIFENFYVSAGNSLIKNISNFIYCERVGDNNAFRAVGNYGAFIEKIVLNKKVLGSFSTTWLHSELVIIPLGVTYTDDLRTRFNSIKNSADLGRITLWSLV